MEREGLQRNAADTGRYLRGRLRELAGRHEAIGDVRGPGLFIGVELVADRAARTPAAERARQVMNGLRERGVLLGVTGRHENVLKIRPPLVFRPEHADLLVDRLDEALSAGP
jgi:4-aminobutyrate aminotransferase-like enzyme